MIESKLAQVFSKLENCGNINLAIIVVRLFCSAGAPEFYIAGVRRPSTELKTEKMSYKFQIQQHKIFVPMMSTEY